MQLGRVIFAGVVVVAALAVTVWVGRSGEELPKQRRTPGGKDYPVPAKTGPYPKAVVDSRSYDFGVMQQGAEGSHVFTIRNEGEAPLRMVARPEDTTCQCTVGKLENGELLPGQSTTIELKWKIKSPAPRFLHSAKIRTNDPENQTIELLIRGAVGKELLVTPQFTWDFGTISETEPTTIEGNLHSDLYDKFAITEIESSNEFITAKYRPLSQDELLKIKEELFPPAEKSPAEFEESASDGTDKNAAGGSDESGTDSADDGSDHASHDHDDDEMLAPTPKAGYRITAIVSPEMPVGSFHETLTVHTDLPENRTARIELTGRRPGPLEFTVLGGARWFNDKMFLRFGRFTGKDGKQVKLLMYVKDLPDFEIEGIDVDEPLLQVTSRLDTDFRGKNRKRFVVNLEVPPGTPPFDRALPNPAVVLIRTNQPGPLATIRIRVELVAS